MTSHGSAYSRFRRALDSGNLTMIRAAAADLPRIGLSDALRVCWAMREDDGGLYERACVRWLGRFCLEAQDVDLADVRTAAGALDAIGQGADGRRALDALNAVCARYRLATL
jgi:hypothetical protein